MDDVIYRSVGNVEDSLFRLSKADGSLPLLVTAGTMWSLDAHRLHARGHTLQGALFGSAGHSDRCPVPELLDRECSLGVLTLEMSRGFLLKMSVHKDQICFYSSIIPKYM